MQKKRTSETSAFEFDLRGTMLGVFGEFWIVLEYFGAVEWLIDTLMASRAVRFRRITQWAETVLGIR